MSDWIAGLKEKFDWPQLFRYFIHAAVIAGLIIAGFRYLRGPEILDAVRSFQYIYIPILLILSAGYLFIKSARFVILMQPVYKLPARVSFLGYAAGMAATLIPIGAAARVVVMKQADVPIEKSTAPIAFSSWTDQILYILTALAAALWYPPARYPALISLLIAVLLLGLVLIPTTRNFLLLILDRVAEKIHLKEKWQGLKYAITQIFTWQVISLSLLLGLIALMTDIFAIHFSVLGIGSSIGYPELVLAVALPTMLGRISGLPGGLGVTGATMIGFLAAATTVNPAAATAAVAIFRIATIFFRTLLGAAIYFFWWQAQEEVKIPH